MTLFQLMLLLLLLMLMLLLLNLLLLLMLLLLNLLMKMKLMKQIWIQKWVIYLQDKGLIRKWRQLWLLNTWRIKNSKFSQDRFHLRRIKKEMMHIQKTTMWMTTTWFRRNHWYQKRNMGNSVFMSIIMQCTMQIQPMETITIDKWEEV